MSGIGSHHSPHRGASDDWLTPPHIIEALGPFDLDPCASTDQPWYTAAIHFTLDSDGLAQPWNGFVWCNPPYGPQTWQWLERLNQHGNGIALIFARTETKGFFESVWRSKATGLLFLEGRLFFHHPDTGERAAHNSGGPSVLISYGSEALSRLQASNLPGSLVHVWRTQ